jgi:hypothetical protein
MHNPDQENNEMNPTHGRRLALAVGKIGIAKNFCKDCCSKKKFLLFPNPRVIWKSGMQGST